MNSIFRRIWNIFLGTCGMRKTDWPFIWSNSIAEFSVDNSIIKPTYMLTYESASELIHLNLEEEKELKTLSEAAALRLQWRRQQVYFFLYALYIKIM